MALSTRPYKGTRDFFPRDKRVQNYLFETMRKTAESFGFEPYDGPLLEEVELYKAKSGVELINEQIYSFTDRGERFVAIRPEMTPTLARMVAQIHKETARPLRWYSIPNLMRYENPQKGRLREHWQLNCDIFGAPPLMAELELFELIVQLFKNFGATTEQFGILINDRQVVDAILEKIQLGKEDAYKLYKIIDRSKKISEKDLNLSLRDLPINDESFVIIKDYLSLTSFNDLFEFLRSHHLSEKAQSLAEFYKKLEDTHLLNFVVYDPTVVRGLDYYTGIVFEVFDKHPDNRRALCGGGAYANLLQIFDAEPLAGIGFGFGDVTLKDFLTVHNLLPNFDKSDIDLLLTYQTEEAYAYAFELAREFRATGLRVELVLSAAKFKKVFPIAEKKGASFVAFIGESELSASQVTIKELSTQKQMTLDRTAIPLFQGF